MVRAVPFTFVLGWRAPVHEALLDVRAFPSQSALGLCGCLRTGSYPISARMTVAFLERTAATASWVRLCRQGKVDGEGCTSVYSALPMPARALEAIREEAGVRGITEPELTRAHGPARAPSLSAVPLAQQRDYLCAAVACSGHCGVVRK